MPLRRRLIRITALSVREVIALAWLVGWVAAGSVLLLVDAGPEPWLGLVAWGIGSIAMFLLPPTSGDADGAVGGVPPADPGGDC